MLTWGWAAAYTAVAMAAVVALLVFDYFQITPPRTGPKTRQ